MYISIHASAREATEIACFCQFKEFPISIHASAREATSKPGVFSARFIFQSTPPRGRRQAGYVLPKDATEISIHASAREATSASFGLFPFTEFQSTPPRGRRLKLPFIEIETNKISIHASAREATLPSADNGWLHDISIHASAREATDVLWAEISKWMNFNPRLREGGDNNPAFKDELIWTFQSTPPRGRRPDNKELKITDRNFNPRLREGGDNFLASSLHRFSRFQSTPPRGRRPH